MGMNMENKVEFLCPNCQFGDFFRNVKYNGIFSHQEYTCRTEGDWNGIDCSKFEPKNEENNEIKNLGKKDI